MPPNSCWEDNSWEDASWDDDAWELFAGTLKVLMVSLPIVVVVSS